VDYASFRSAGFVENIWIKRYDRVEIGIPLVDVLQVGGNDFDR